MNSAGILCTVLTVGMMLSLPKRWAMLPLLLAVFYVPRSQIVLIGPFSFPLLRLLILAGTARVMMKGERIAGGLNRLDKMMLIWAFWSLLSAMFHETGPSMARFGEIYTDLGVYFLCRCFIQNAEGLERVCLLVSILLVPVALAMLIEQQTGTNSWAAFWGESTHVMLRKSGYRARGPFAHPILAGTVGAVCFPMCVYLWNNKPLIALVGLAATTLVVVAGGSSGPMITVIAIMGAMIFWKFRAHLRKARWLFVLMLIVLQFVMKDPVYYLVARLDVSAGSTGWFRAYLIQCALEHLNEWWLVGTDFTRHWMPRGLGGSDTSADITNHFIQMGVWGGLPLMILFTIILVIAFSYIGKALQRNKNAPTLQQFLIWTLGCILFGHVVTFLSVSYFDPALILHFHLVLATIGSLSAPNFFLQSSNQSTAHTEFETPTTNQLNHG